MDNLVILCGPADIAPALQLVQRLPSHRCLVFDPVLVDQAANAGLQHIEFIQWEACPAYHVLEGLAHNAADAIETKLDGAMRGVLPDLSLRSWQHLNFYYFFMAFYWYSGLWDAMRERLLGHKVHLLVCNNPAHNYAPSFVPALLLLLRLRDWGVEFSGTGYAHPTETYDVVPDLAAGLPPQARYDVLTHLPTCFYDVNYFNAELHASGLRCVNLKAKYWDVPIAHHHNIGLVPLAAAPATRELAPIAAQLEETLDALLAPLLASPAYRTRQAKHFSTLYQTQIVAHDLLQRAFDGHAPARLLLSDHDAGFHGPLLQFAQSRGIPAVMVPHAKTSGSTEFRYRHLTMLTHPVQAGPLLDGEGHQLQHQTLAYPEMLTTSTGPRAPLKRIGILLNGIALNGVLCSEFASYLAQLRQIDQWCQARSLELVIRSRPAQSLVRLLHSGIGADAQALNDGLLGSLQVFVAGIDLCLMYDAPTSAGIEVLRTGVPLLNPIPSPLGKAEGLGADTRLVPRASVEATLAMLDTFVQDPTVLDQFAREQFAAYAERFARSKPLRRFL